jgi:hypothetical protein
MPGGSARVFTNIFVGRFYNQAEVDPLGEVVKKRMKRAASPVSIDLFLKIPGYFPHQFFELRYLRLESGIPA